MQHADLIVTDAAQLVTCASPGGPRRGAALADVGLIEQGSLAIGGGRILAVGPAAQIARDYRAARTLDARGRVVCPGFVDCHTHAVYAGDRLDEFEQRLGGASYQSIAAAGGGILSTVRASRAASREAIVGASRRRLAQMRALGTTTAEVKTGYGLDLPTELKLLEAIAELDATQDVELVPTFLAAHAVPPEYRGRADDYLDLVIREGLPAARAWHAGSRFAARGVPLFVDVFCEQHAFDLAQAQRLLEAGRALGLPLKAHVDQFTELGGLEAALMLGAVSVDHLDVTGEDGIAALAASRAVGVLIPTATFNLAGTRYADARGMIEAGAAIALTTDINPGSAPCPSLPMAMAIACRYQRLRPAEALNAVTINAAHAIGRGEEIGSLEPGKQADALLLDCGDYRELACQFGANQIQAVIKRGKILQ